MIRKNFRYGLLFLPIGLLACNGNQPQGGSTPLGSVYEQKPVMVVQKKDLCFLRADGAGNRDTMKVHLAINGTLVEGSMDYMPYEKDARRGLLSGTVTDDIIKVRWTFSQEGLKDTLSLDLRLTEEALLQRPLKPNPETGREETDISADYGQPMPRINCL
jgi:hypothetical protein